MDSTRAYFTSPELIELEAAYCLFSFSVSGVENIARGLSPKDSTREVVALKEVPWSEIFSRLFNRVLFFKILVDKFVLVIPNF